MNRHARPLTAVEHGLMLGFPPPADKVVNTSNWQEGPYNRWGFLNVSQILPTAIIDRGPGPVSSLPHHPQDLGGLVVDCADGPVTLDEVLARTYTDGFLVLKNGAIVMEHYANGMTPFSRHLSMSVSKSLTGALASILVEMGLLDLAQTVSFYVQELRSSGYATATVQQVLDMVVSLAFREDYDDPTSDLQTADRVNGWRPALASDVLGNYHFLPTIQQDGEHGRVFQYCSTDTDVLGWIMEKVSGLSFYELFSREIWSKLGAERDAYITVDACGASLPNGGFCLTLRDLARFGQMMLQDGDFNGQAIVPARWIDDTRNKGDNKPWSMQPRWSALFPHGNYHNQWYNVENSHRCYFGIGIYGQHLWIDPSAEVVIVKYSTRPQALDPEMSDDTFRLFEAIGHCLC